MKVKWWVEDNSVRHLKEYILDIPNEEFEVVQHQLMDVPKGIRILKNMT